MHPRRHQNPSTAETIAKVMPITKLIIIMYILFLYVLCPFMRVFDRPSECFVTSGTLVPMEIILY